LDGPLPVAPPRSLLNVSGVLVPPGSDRFGVGAVVWPYPPGLPQAWDGCSEGTFRTKAAAEGWDLPQFSAFTLYLPITCSSITAHAPGFYDRVELAFAARESYGVAHELARGIANPMNPFLSDGDLTILPTAAGVAQTADVALSYLENAIGETGQQGIILTTPAVGAALNGSGGYQLETRSGALVTSANATPVALDGGFIGTSPSLHPALTAGTDWMFATGPIQVRRNGDIIGIPTDISEATDRASNEVTFMAERDYLVIWDTQLQAGVLVDWSP
jgi:hypothetical protein